MNRQVLAPPRRLRAGASPIQSRATAGSRQRSHRAEWIARRTSVEESPVYNIVALMHHVGECNQSGRPRSHTREGDDVDDDGDFSYLPLSTSCSSGGVCGARPFAGLPRVNAVALGWHGGVSPVREASE